MTVARSGFAALIGVALVSLSAAPAALAATTSVPFTADGSWTVPSGVTSVDVLMVGGGGAGGPLVMVEGNGGGGGGEVRVCPGLSVSAGSVLSVTVGQGGTGTAGLQPTGSPGGASSLAAGASVLCTAAGGLGGQRQDIGGFGGASGSGNAGGAGTRSVSYFPGGGGGGGGAGAQGADGSGLYASTPPPAGGAGGAGSTPAAQPAPGLFSNDSSRFGGGGGGGAWNDSLGGVSGMGVDGGGNGGTFTVTNQGIMATSGAAGSGGGGGGASSDGPTVVSGSGGSGYAELRFVVGQAVPGVSPPAPDTPAPQRITICHSEAGGTLVSLTMTPEAVVEGHSAGHKADIIPPFSYLSGSQTLTYPGKNWDAEGRATLAAGCQPSPASRTAQVFDPPQKNKVTLCHSGNGKNFTRITVAPSAALNGHARNHDDDIIPPFSYGSVSFAGLNWDASGRTVWDNGCSAPQPVTDPVAAPAQKVSLCHSAGGTKYVSIDVAPAAALNGHASEHAADIIPPFTYREGGRASGEEETFPGKNWDTAGRAIFNNGCVAPEEPEPQPVSPEVTCVESSPDGSYTAHFGYRSEDTSVLTIEQGADNAVTFDGAAPGASISGPPTTFQPGAVASAVTVSGVPGGRSVTWSITSGSSTRTAVATNSSPRCASDPAPSEYGLFAACTEQGAGGDYSVTFGYQNDNIAPLQAPVGAGNRVTVNGAGNPDRGQPSSLAPGRFPSAFTVTGLKARDVVVWEVTVGGQQRVATATSSTPACDAPEPELLPVGPSVRCVGRNGDGTYNVVFGYANPNQVTVTVPGGGANALSLSPGDPGPETRGQPTAFVPGSVSDAFVVRDIPVGQEITWTIASQGTRSATAGVAFPERCAGDVRPPDIDPDPDEQAIGIYLKCVDAGRDSFSATFGYVNPGSTAVTIPVGSSNGFLGGAVDRGQPTVFSPGDAQEAFRVTGIPIRERPTWRVRSPDGSIALAVADPAAPNCTTGDPDRGPWTDLRPSIPTSTPPNRPDDIEIGNPGTEIDWRPVVEVVVTGPARPTNIRDEGMDCRRLRKKVICRGDRILPGQGLQVSFGKRCRRAGVARVSIAAVVRQATNRFGRTSSSSGSTRIKRCGPAFTG